MAFPAQPPKSRNLGGPFPLLSPPPKRISGMTGIAQKYRKIRGTPIHAIGVPRNLHGSVRVATLKYRKIRGTPLHAIGVPRNLHGSVRVATLKMA